jgi:hypothetical protein
MLPVLAGTAAASKHSPPPHTPAVVCPILLILLAAECLTFSGCTSRVDTHTHLPLCALTRCSSAPVLRAQQVSQPSTSPDRQQAPSAVTARQVRAAGAGGGMGVPIGDRTAGGCGGRSCRMQSPMSMSHTCDTKQATCVVTRRSTAVSQVGFAAHRQALTAQQVVRVQYFGYEGADWHMLLCQRVSQCCTRGAYKQSHHHHPGESVEECVRPLCQFPASIGPDMYSPPHVAHLHTSIIRRCQHILP